ncbi:MAG: FGGY-family carbohydrate kinase, partial [Actinomycetales bacterium]
SGAWRGLRLATDRAAMLRSILEGIATGIALAVDAVRATGAPWPPVVPRVGGGTHDPAFRQLLASATGCALAVVEAPDAAVIGAAMTAMGRVRAPSAPPTIQVVEPDPVQAEVLGLRRAGYLAACQSERAR